jgi:hypothetical protein
MMEGKNIAAIKLIFRIEATFVEIESGTGADALPVVDRKVLAAKISYYSVPISIQNTAFCLSGYNGRI